MLYDGKYMRDKFLNFNERTHTHTRICFFFYQKVFNNYLTKIYVIQELLKIVYIKINYNKR